MSPEQVFERDLLLYDAAVIAVGHPVGGDHGEVHGLLARQGALQCVDAVAQPTFFLFANGVFAAGGIYFHWDVINEPS